MSQTADETLRDVPDAVIPRGDLPPLRYRDLPPAVPVRQMIGPSVILAGLALGSGEFILWPSITHQAGFAFFWACVLGVATQFFMNLEITRWALVTGESAITGFSRLSRHWAGVYLVLNIVPWAIPAWAVGASELTSWLVWGAELDAHGAVVSRHVGPLAIASLVGCGLVLTAGPVIYETVERVQLALVGLILVLVVVIAALLVRPDAVAAMARGTIGFQLPPADGPITAAMLLGAVAFAGAGGTLNLGQSNYVKEKGYAMGRYIGRITSPLTGKDEAAVEIGYHFPHTPENLARWRQWWRAANVEHFVSFFLTCLVCLALLSLVSYSAFHDADGGRVAGAEKYKQGLAFVLGEAELLQVRFGAWARIAFLVMGVAILFTTEFGVLDAATRISTDLVKVNWLRESEFWSESRLYTVFLWGLIGLAVGVMLLTDPRHLEGLKLFKLTASLNGAVMFLYSGMLLYMNWRRLPGPVRMRPWRFAVMGWATLFFGYFTVQAAWQLAAGWFPGG